MEGRDRRAQAGLRAVPGIPTKPRLLLESHGVQAYTTKLERALTWIAPLRHATPIPYRAVRTARPPGGHRQRLVADQAEGGIANVLLNRPSSRNTMNRIASMRLTGVSSAALGSRSVSYNGVAPSGPYPRCRARARTPRPALA